MNEPLTPSLRLLTFAIVLPAAVAVGNQMLLQLAPRDWLQLWMYPWMAASVAVLSWCSARYLKPGWIGWIVFAWSLILLDLLTIIACLAGPISGQFGYVLVSAQISLLVLWAILGPGEWQWRLPGVAAIAPLVVVFSGSFTGDWSTSRYWNEMMVLTTVVSTLLCGGLRFLGFALRDEQALLAQQINDSKRPIIQFGMKHMLIWLTVTGPLLLVVRGIDLDGQTFFPAALLAFSIATVNLIAIWAVLGSGFWLIRIIALPAIPFLIGLGLTAYSGHLEAANSQFRYVSIAFALVQMKDFWIGWVWLDAALLASLLLFLRARGCRLLRLRKQSPKVKQSSA